MKVSSSRDDCSISSKDGMPFVSVVVPIFNAERYLSEALESLCNQTIDNLEFICVNDGSTDSSLEILKRYASNDERIRIIDQENGGYGKAMNTGLKNIRGEYFGILEPDDYVWTGMYECLYKAAKEANADIVQGDAVFFSGDSAHRKFHRKRLAASSRDYYKIFAPKKDPFPVRPNYQTWSAIYRKAMISDNSITYHETPGASFQDTGFWFKAFSSAESYLIVDQPCYFYRRDNLSSSTNRSNGSAAKAWALIKELEAIKDDLEQNPRPLSPFFKDLFWNRYCRGVYSSLWLCGDRHQQGEILDHAASTIKNSRYGKTGIRSTRLKFLNIVCLFCIVNTPRFFLGVSSIRSRVKRFKEDRN